MTIRSNLFNQFKLRIMASFLVAIIIGWMIMNNWQMPKTVSASDEWQPNSLQTIRNRLPQTFNAATRHYTIQYGDTLNTIAEVLNVNANTLVADNQLANVDLIYAGYALSITKDEGGYVPAKQTTGTVIAQPMPVASLVNTFDGKQLTPVKNK
ncbi:LysM peptidoglycan-binding domain-containing protein [Leuconostoc pseudomesenteroides]|uniref:LysM peptidoglycan-binding domain-containing protein n=1 Tax=Leuconostoc pseudomesenteroides TaxID=33968 RepID=UPI00403717F9